MYVEDMDLCFRPRRAGWKTVYELAATLMHSRGRSSRHRRFRSICTAFQDRIGDRPDKCQRGVGGPADDRYLGRTSRAVRGYRFRNGDHELAGARIPESLARRCRPGPFAPGELPPTALTSLVVNSGNRDQVLSRNGKPIRPVAVVAWDLRPLTSGRNNEVYSWTGPDSKSASRSIKSMSADVPSASGTP